MSSALFRRLAFLAVILVAITLFTLDRVVARYAWDHQVEAEQHRLLNAGQLIVSSAPTPGLVPAWCKAAEARVQWINSTLTVVADCDSTSSAIGTAISEDDVREALQGRTGLVSRWDGFRLATAVAVPLANGDGAIRLTSSIDRGPVIAQMRERVAMIALAAALFALLVAYIVSRKLAQRVSRLKVVAEGLLDSTRASAGIVNPDDDLGTLESTLRRVDSQLRDLLERWRLESSRSEAILASLAEGVLAVDSEMRVVFCNPAVARSMGMRVPVRERTPLIELMRDTEMVGLLKRALESGERVKRTLKMPVASGRAFEVQAVPFAMAGGTGALAILYDMTDLERLEQVRKDFVANVSHEMRTPLAAIVGYSDTLLDGAFEDTENNRRFVEVIRTNAIRLNSIASDLLVLSELESGTTPGEPEAVPVLEAIESAMTIVESEARSRNVRVIVGQIDNVLVKGHRFRLEQAMLNLLVNAVKFNRANGEVRVEARRIDGLVRISVADTGMGIPSQDLPRIFERFYRVDKARSRQVGGTGLGLSIVRHVVERMNGKIEVESQLGKGSTFTITLPAC